MSQAYNIKITPIAAATETTTAAGKQLVKVRATLKIRGRDTERTVTAQGNAADLVRDILVPGEEVSVRALFERAPANEDGTPGGEFLTVVALPRAKKAA